MGLQVLTTKKIFIGNKQQMKVTELRRLIREELRHATQEQVVGSDKDQVISLIQKLKAQGKLDPDAEKTLYDYMNHPAGTIKGMLSLLKLI